MVDRLISEISLARTVEKALLARRMLRSGRQVPEIYAVQVVQDHVDDAIAQLNRDIDNLLFENRVRKEIVSDT